MATLLMFGASFQGDNTFNVFVLIPDTALNLPECFYKHLKEAETHSIPEHLRTEIVRTSSQVRFYLGHVPKHQIYGSGGTFLQGKTKTKPHLLSLHFSWLTFHISVACFVVKFSSFLP